jgi:hypothetical protein
MRKFPSTWLFVVRSSDLTSLRREFHPSSPTERTFVRFIGQVTIFLTQPLPSRQVCYYIGPWRPVYTPSADPFISSDHNVALSLALILSAMLVDAWTLGRYQAFGFAKVWSKKARLPSIKNMWAAYPGAGHELLAHSAQGESKYIPCVPIFSY